MREEGRKNGSSSCLQQQLKASFPFMPGAIYNCDTNQLQKELSWVSFTSPLAFVLLHSEGLGLSQ